jgi:hypothetical protein
MFYLFDDGCLSLGTNVCFQRLIFAFALSHCTVSVCCAKDREKTRGKRGFRHASGQGKSCGAHGPVEFAEGTVRFKNIEFVVPWVCRNLNLCCNFFELQFNTPVMRQ